MKNVVCFYNKAISLVSIHNTKKSRGKHLVFRKIISNENSEQNQKFASSLKIFTSIKLIVVLSKLKFYDKFTIKICSNILIIWTKYENNKWFNAAIPRSLASRDPRRKSFT